MRLKVLTNIVDIKDEKTETIKVAHIILFIYLYNIRRCSDPLKKWVFLIKDQSSGTFGLILHIIEYYS